MFQGNIVLKPGVSNVQIQIKNSIKRRLQLQQFNIEYSLTQFLRETVRYHLLYSPMISWIIQDWSLRGELGFTPSLAAQILSELPNDIAKTAHVKMKSRSKLISFRAYIVHLYYKDLYAKAYASYVSYNRKNRKKARMFKIPWLRWLLERGGDDVVMGYDVEYVPGTPFSRSQTGLVMVESPGNWSVPEEISGTREDNFITNAVKDKLVDIRAAFKEQIIQSMKMALK